MVRVWQARKHPHRHCTITARLRIRIDLRSQLAGGGVNVLLLAFSSVIQNAQEHSIGSKKGKVKMHFYHEDYFRGLQLVALPSE